MKRTLIWIGALVLGALLGFIGLAWINDLAGFMIM